MPWLLAVFLLILVTPAAAAPSCAPFNDPGCLFGEDFSSYPVGSVPGAPWAWNPIGNVLVAPGPVLQGTVPPKPGPGWVANGSCEGCPGGSVSLAGTFGQGDEYWLEATLTYGPTFQWGTFPNGNCSTKTIDLLGGPGAADRILVTIWQPGCPTGNPATGTVQVSMYPNYAAGGTDAGGATNKATEKYSNTGTNKLLQAGSSSRLVAWVKVGTGATGAYRVWVDGTKTHDFSGLQTARAVPWSLSTMGLGGPQAGPAPGSTWSWSRLRVTRTALVPPIGPTGPSGPSGPSGPTGPMPPPPNTARVTALASLATTTTTPPPVQPPPVTATVRVGSVVTVTPTVASVAACQLTVGASVIALKPPYRIRLDSRDYPAGAIVKASCLDAGGVVVEVAPAVTLP